MNVRDLFQLQGSFHCNGIIDPTANKEHMTSSQITVGKFLNLLFHAKQGFNLIWKLNQVTSQLCKFFICEHASYFGKFHGKQIHSCKLCTVRFGSGNGNFRACPCIHYIICFSSNRASYYIDDTQCSYSMILCVTQCCQRISCFP